MKRRLFFLFMAFAVMVSGCDAFVRKFTRKPKGDKVIREELVIVPEEYNQSDDPHLRYRQAFVNWQVWHDELINSLDNPSSKKRQLACIDEALRWLKQMQEMLMGPLPADLTRLSGRLAALRDKIAGDIYSQYHYQQRQEAELLRKQISKQFSYPHIKEYLR